MVKNINWIDILTQCKNGIQKQIAPFLKKVNAPQPTLGVGAGGDHIKPVDLVAENAIIKTITKCNLSFTLISEESGIKKYGADPSSHYITTDPIDGTTNLIRGIPFYATSIAVSTTPFLNTIHTALVTDLVHEITYIAQKGEGSYRNDKKICTAKNMPLKDVVIGLDLNIYPLPRTTQELMACLKIAKHIRHLGANALELCYVADGTMAAFIDIRGKLRATDMAAAWLILVEAGAKVTSPHGKPLNTPLSPTQRVSIVAAANEKIHHLVRNVLKTEKERK